MRRLTAAALAAGAALAAHASSLQISPVTVELPPGQNASALTLRNPGKEPVYGQVRVFRWDQAPDDDRLEPSEDLVASPPLIRIEPQGEQLVRLVRRDGSAVAEERYYRVLVDEVPNLDAAPGNGVNIRLRYSVPVFLEPAGAPALPKLSWELRREGAQWQLRVSNTGGRRAQLAAVRVVGADGAAQEINPGLLGYVLAGRTRQWTIALDDKLAAHGPLKLRANLNAQPIETELSVAARP
ncbi:molecular chaperone [Dyella sp. LX-66]|uniref:fimbrial biogenesis chaperone n=1 Tax=unclassified Dyella TaxID=2634549 RepID=UPI001BE0161E|nr:MULTISPECIES: molecular chaperone [unclassified Dyella]MBT2115562.1 molecular chaperone [Dyella sp. LX-1]MBT2139377.1 molecular chaperone [Dyella sp. LX-66]